MRKTKKNLYFPFEFAWQSLVPSSASISRCVSRKILKNCLHIRSPARPECQIFAGKIRYISPGFLSSSLMLRDGVSFLPLIHFLRQSYHLPRNQQECFLFFTSKLYLFFGQQKCFEKSAIWLNSLTLEIKN